jgi:hypothetical protein
MKYSSKILKSLSLLVFGLLLFAGGAFGQTLLDVTFGSNDDGLAGFTQTGTSTYSSWTTQPDSVRYSLDGGGTNDTGTENSSFLREIVINRTNGYEYNMTGTLTWVDGNVDRNSRFGMYLFGDASTIPNEDELGAIGTIYNSDDGGFGNNSNADDDWNLTIGIDQSTIVSLERVQTLVPVASNNFGSLVTMSTDFSFFDNAGTDSIFIETTLTMGGESTTISTTVAAADYTGDYFGFVNRARDGNERPWIVDYETFILTQTGIPEPSSFALFALGLSTLAFLRRRSQKS